MEGINSDKVNIHVGGEGGGGGAGGLAAVIAALGNRNQGNDNAALIAALGNRNDDSANLGPLLAMMNNRRDDGMNNLWPIILLALLGRGRGGLLGGGGEDCPTDLAGAGTRTALLQTLAEGQSAIRAEIPAVGLQTQNAIQQAVAALALGTQQGFANTKDAVQASLLSNLTATSGVKDSVMNNAALLQRDICDVKATVQTEACATRELVQAGTTAILTRIDRSEIDELRARADRAERAIEVNALRSQVEVNQTVNTTQAQAQGQFQVQRQNQDIRDELRDLRHAIIVGNQVMQARQGQDVINFGGTMTASGTQAAANTQVR